MRIVSETIITVIHSDGSTVTSRKTPINGVKFPLAVAWQAPIYINCRMSCVEGIMRYNRKNGASHDPS